MKLTARNLGTGRALLLSFAPPRSKYRQTLLPLAAQLQMSVIIEKVAIAMH